MRTALIIAAAGAIAIAGFAVAQGPRAPAEPGARAPQEQQLERQERQALRQQLHREEGAAQDRQLERYERQERQALRHQLHREQVEAIATMTREQTMLRKAECDAASDATATMTRTQRGPQARW